MSFLRGRRTTFMGSSLPWWIGVVYVGVFRGPPEERLETGGRR